MSAQRQRILRKTKDDELTLAAPTNFELQPAGDIDPGVVVRDPRVSLYCVDPELPQALFVRTPEIIDPSGISFFYVEQYRQCQEVIVLSLEDMHRVAADVPFDSGRLIFLHSTGRCGSTLLSKAFGALSDVRSFSEPDFLTKVTNLRAHDGTRDSAIGDLCESAVRLQGKPLNGVSGSYTVFKFRSQVMELADLLWERFPESHALFLYRDALTWLDSFLRSLLRDLEFTDEVNRSWEEWLSRCHPVLKEYHRPEKPMSPACLWTLGWVSSVERYLELLDKGMPSLAVRFEDLKREPLFVFRAILDHLGFNTEALLRQGSEQHARILAAFNVDSQAGTRIEKKAMRDAPGTPEHYLQEAREVLKTRPRILRSDFRVPGTLEVPSG